MNTFLDPPPVARAHCRHYSYERAQELLDGGPGCAVGIDLSGPGASRRCWPNPDTPCASRENWTDEEKAKWQSWQDSRTARMISAVAALPALDGRATTKMACPSCDGTVTYVRIPTRAYVECSTPHCMKFEANVRGTWPGKST